MSRAQSINSQCRPPLYLTDGSLCKDRLLWDEVMSKNYIPVSPFSVLAIVEVEIWTVKGFQNDSAARQLVLSIEPFHSYPKSHRSCAACLHRLSSGLVEPARTAAGNSPFAKATQATLLVETVCIRAVNGLTYLDDRSGVQSTADLRSRPPRRGRLRGLVLCTWPQVCHSSRQNRLIYIPRQSPDTCCSPFDRITSQSLQPPSPS